MTSMVVAGHYLAQFTYVLIYHMIKLIWSYRHDSSWSLARRALTFWPIFTDSIKTQAENLYLVLLALPSLCYSERQKRKKKFS